MYSPTVMEHFGNPRNVGKPSGEFVTGLAGKIEEGPFMVLYIGVEDSRIARVGFQTYGCGPTIASGSLLTELIKGRRCDEALAITPEQLIEQLGGLPLGKRHCAEIAIAALANGLRAVASVGHESANDNNGK